MKTDPISTANSEPPATSTSDEIEVYEVTFSSPQTSSPTVKMPPPITVKPEPKAVMSPILAAIYKRGGFGFSWSGSHESCGAYIAV